MDDPRPFGFDAMVEFPPHNFPRFEITDQVEDLVPGFEGNIWDYGRGASAMAVPKVTEFPVYRGVMPGWDNSPRIGKRAQIFSGSLPGTYGTWLERVVRETAAKESSAKFVFINSWNEWGEGAQLEPSRGYGCAYLEATRKALIAGTGQEEEDSRRGFAVWTLNERQLEKRKTGARPLVLVSHDAARAGAQILLLEMLESLSAVPDLELFVILRHGW